MIILDETQKELVIPNSIGNYGASSSDVEIRKAFNDGKEAQKVIDEEKLTPSITLTENGEYEADYGYRKVVVDIPLKLQEKLVLFGETSSVVKIRPDAGYDGMSYVEADATQLVRKAEEYGFEEGFERGQIHVKDLMEDLSVTENGVYESPNGYKKVTVDVPSVSTMELTADEYEALEEKDPMVIYCIKKEA